MSEADSVAGQEAQEAKPEVRLRRAERRQIAMVVQCPDDLVGPSHAVRMVMAVVEKLDVSGFCEPIKAREGQAGRGGTEPQLLGGVWVEGWIRGGGLARGVARRWGEGAAV